MSTDDNINAGISVLVDTDMSLDHLDGILTTLRKHGLSPRYFEYEPEQDAPKAAAALTYEPELDMPKVDAAFRTDAVAMLSEVASSFDDGYWRVTETTTDDDGTTTTQTVTDEKP